MVQARARAITEPLACGPLGQPVVREGLGTNLRPLGVTRRGEDEPEGLGSARFSYRR
jgi:hypothetical protein